MSPVWTLGALKYFHTTLPSVFFDDCQRHCWRSIVRDIVDLLKDRADLEVLETLLVVHIAPKDKLFWVKLTGHSKCSRIGHVTIFQFQFKGQALRYRHAEFIF